MIPTLQAALLPKNGRFSSVDITRALTHLSLLDLQSYVPEAAARRWMQDRSFPIAAHAFSLHEALHDSGPNRWRGKVGAPIGSSTIYESRDVACCWFVIPPGGILPLHDHCMMRVWQRVLYGRLQVTSIDWAKSGTPEDMIRCKQYGGEGIVVASRVLEEKPDACDLSSIVASFGPDHGGVLHEISNESADPALLVDVITPPYHTPPHNIDCTYFSAMPLDSSTALLPPQLEGAGCQERLQAGQRVRLAPRIGYDGPLMDAFVLL